MVQPPVGSLLLSSRSWCAQDFVCALQDWSLCFPHSCGRRVIKSHWPSRSDSLGSPSPFVGSPGWKLDTGFRTFTTVGELLWYYYSPVCGSLSLWVWDLTFAMMASLLPSHCDFFLVFERGVSFPSGFQCPPITDSSIWSFHIKRRVHILLLCHLELDSSEKVF